MTCDELTDETIIVDDNDQVIGSKPRNELNASDIYRVSALWIINSNKEVLIAQRSFKKKNQGGKWGPAVAGTLEKGETYDSNIVKELAEEIGVKRVIPEKFKKIRIKTSDNNYFVQWYTLVLDMDIKDFTLEEDGVEAVKWISFENLNGDFEKNPNNYTEGFPRYIELFKELS